MADRPLLFRAEMVQAILAGKKSETRRVAEGEKPRWTQGDRIWVRESWRVIRPEHGAPVLEYRADRARRLVTVDNGLPGSSQTRAGDPWRSGQSMPKAAARLWLLVTEVRRERLSEINDERARAEGVPDLAAFIALWDGIHGAGENAWRFNPVVDMIQFEPTDRAIFRAK